MLVRTILDTNKGEVSHAISWRDEFDFNWLVFTVATDASSQEDACGVTTTLGPTAFDVKSKAPERTRIFMDNNGMSCASLDTSSKASGWQYKCRETESPDCE